MQPLATSLLYRLFLFCCDLRRLHLDDGSAWFFLLLFNMLIFY